MTQPFNDFERRLAEALDREVSLAMTMTDTSRELRRWRDNQHNRRTRLRVAAAVAAVAAVAGVIIGVTVVGGHTAKQVPADRNPAPTGPRSSTIGPLPALPASTRVTSISGPVNLSPAVSFGAVWGTGFGATSGHLYRLAPATGAVLSDTSFAGPVQDGLPPFQVGQVMLLPTAPAHGPRGYLVYAADGRPTGRLVSAALPGPGAGDANGGWVRLTATTLGRLDAAGRLVRTVQVPAQALEIEAIGVGPAGVWVGYLSSDVVRLDPSTGAPLSTVHVDPSAGTSAQLLSTSVGVFEATANNKVVRIDANGTVTAVATTQMSKASIAALTMGPDGNLWAQPDQGGVAVLDPRTLAVVRGMQVFPDSRGGGVSGITVTAQRVFVGDVDRGRTVTFATP